MTKTIAASITAAAFLAIAALPVSAAGQRRERHQPPDLTREQLTAIRDSKQGEVEGLDTLITGFDAADSDRNGLLSPAEMRAYAQANGVNLPRPHRSPPQTKDHFIELLDRIVQAEGQAPPALTAVIENFGAADSNHDGILSRDEFNTFLDATGLEMPHPSGRLRP